MKMLEMDWNKKILANTTNLPHGFRLLAGDDSSNHWLGGGGMVRVECPGCQSQMLTGWGLDYSDERIQSVVEWDEERLQVYVCPNCDLYQEPYWIFFKDKIRMVAGNTDEVEKYMDATLPYRRSRCTMLPLESSDYPTSDDNIIDLLTRERTPGIYHQIGGTPLIRGFTSLACCDCGLSMSFSGILDYDATNIVLPQSDGSEAGLELGDLGYLDVFTCRKCSVVGVSFSTG